AHPAPPVFLQSAPARGPLAGALLPDRGAGHGRGHGVRGRCRPQGVRPGPDRGPHLSLARAALAPLRARTDEMAVNACAAGSAPAVEVARTAEAARAARLAV